MDYLSETEQYRDILNNEEISRIRDPRLRDIRMKYWKLRNDAFLDEYNISDTQLEKVWDDLCKKEAAEIAKYKLSISAPQE